MMFLFMRTWGENIQAQSWSVNSWLSAGPGPHSLHHSRRPFNMFPPYDDGKDHVQMQPGVMRAATSSLFHLGRRFWGNYRTNLHHILKMRVGGGEFEFCV